VRPYADEVALLQQRLDGRVEFGIGKDRYANGRMLEKKGVNWFILDDGFQHLALARDANILLVDAMDPFGGGRLLPAGRLREPRAAIGRADIVVITRADHAPAVEAIVRRYTQAPVFYAHTELESTLRVPGMVQELAPEQREKLKVLAFCGIGNPTGFFYDLRRWGFDVKGEKTFRDHHAYKATDIAKLDRLADAAGAEALICTEKDAFNLQDVPEKRIPIYVCRIRLVLTQGDAFWSAVMEAIRRNRPAGRG
jgi:tetraacyldisaccharide 4'-kinase